MPGKRTIKYDINIKLDTFNIKEEKKKIDEEFKDYKQDNKQFMMLTELE